MPYGFIVIASYIDDLRAFMRLAEKLIKNFVDCFCPVPAFMKFPSIYDIADKIQCLRFRFSQEVEQGSCNEIFSADVKIGQENRSVDIRFCICFTGQAEPRIKAE